MKRTLLALFLGLTTFADYSLDIDFKSSQNGEKVAFSKKVKAQLGKSLGYKIPNSNKILKVKLSNKVPKEYSGELGKGEEVFVQFKLLEESGGKTSVIASPEVLTLVGDEARMESFDSNDLNNPVLQVKVLPRKL